MMGVAASDVFSMGNPEPNAISEDARSRCLELMGEAEARFNETINTFGVPLNEQHVITMNAAPKSGEIDFQNIDLPC